MPESVLSVSELSKSFGDIRAVSGVSLEIHGGEIVGLLGPNGAGKTTTIGMICGLLQPDSGSVTVNGHDFSKHAREAQRSMGVVPQEVALYEELSADQNLIFWGKLAGLSAANAKKRSKELLVELSLEDRGQDPVSEYSGGMKRRVNIGCALMHEPKLLLLDEPTVGIDPQARANILEFVRGLAKRGTGVLYTTHYLDEAESLCERINIIDEGKVLAEGTLSELQNRLGGDRLFVLEGDFANSDPIEWGVHEKYQVIHQTDDQLVLSSIADRHPSDCLKELLDIPVRIENATMKRPNLNDVYLQLTGRDLRE